MLVQTFPSKILQSPPHTSALDMPGSNHATESTREHPETQHSVDEGESGVARATVAVHRLTFVDAVTGAVLTPERVLKLLPSGQSSPIEIQAPSISLEARETEQCVVIAMFPWHLAQLAAIPASDHACDQRIRVEPCGRVAFELRLEGDVTVKEDDLLIVEPHRAAVDQAEGRGNRHRYFSANNAGDDWHFLPASTEDLVDPDLVRSLYERVVKEMLGSQPSEAGVYARPCVRFESDRRLLAGREIRLRLPAGGPYRWSSNRNLRFDPVADWSDAMQREANLSPTEIPFPAGTLNDGWFRVEVGMETSVSLLLSEACAIRGSVPPREVAAFNPARVALYRIERPGLGGNVQPSASEVLKATPGLMGGFEFIDLTPGEYRICASWQQDRQMHTFARLMSLAPGETMDLGLLSAPGETTLSLHTFLRDTHGELLAEAAVETARCQFPIQIFSHDFEDPLAHFADYLFVDLSGTTEIRGLPPGTWTVLVPTLVKLEDYLPSHVRLGSRPNPATFTLASQAQIEYPIEVMRGLLPAEVSIAFPDELSASRFWWNLASSDGQVHLQRGEVRGSPGGSATVKVELPAGDYHFFVTEKSPLDSREHRGWYGWTRFSVNDDAVRTVATMASGRSIRGRVIPEAERPMTGYPVSFDLISFNGNEESTRNQFLAFCDADGHFVLNGVPDQAILVSRISGERILVAPNLETIEIRL